MLDVYKDISSNTGWGGGELVLVRTQSVFITFFPKKTKKITRRKEDKDSSTM